MWADKRMNTELDAIIQQLAAARAVLHSQEVILRRIRNQPWPDIPNGEGLTADTSPVTCVCNHAKRDHHPTAGGCRICQCAGFIGTLTDPRD
jgi:hypothetical protein